MYLAVLMPPQILGTLNLGIGSGEPHYVFIFLEQADVFGKVVQAILSPGYLTLVIRLNSI
jgi:hypothetical protein